MAEPRRGLTLIELLVAMALLALVTTLATRFVIHLFELTGRAGQRSKMQSEGMVSLKNLSADLQQTQAARIAQADLPGGGKAVGFVRLQEITGQGALVWEDKAVVYGWDPTHGTLVRKVVPPTPGGVNLAFDPARPPLLASSDLAAIVISPNGSERCLSDCVTGFSLTVADLAVDLQLDLAVPGHKLETLTLKSTLALRN